MCFQMQMADILLRECFKEYNITFCVIIVSLSILTVSPYCQ